MFYSEIVSAGRQVEEKQSYHFRVTGRVQGVWFRQSTRQQAQLLGLGGWVKNMPDGSVEGVASGTPAALQTLRDWLGRGPEMARVMKLEWQAMTPQVFDGFEVR